MATEDGGIWASPRCLVENWLARGEGAMRVNEDTLGALKEVEQPLVCVSIVGLYRTGKSYLMNRLAGCKSGFALGSTVQAKTKGIWVWCLRHPTRPTHRLLLMDTEGLGDVEKSNVKNDSMLFTLAALLSSTLIYNSKGTIDQTAIDNMKFVTEVAERFKISAEKDSAEEDDVGLGEFFPSFIWTLRDFTLKLEIDGRAVTADEYLENSLKLKKGASKSVVEYNQPRRCIRRYFPTRKCFAFPLPVPDPALLERLGDLRADKMVLEFLQRSKEFCDYVYASAETKAVGGIAMNGAKFAGLVSHYTHAVAAGQTPSIQGAVLATAASVNDSLIADCLARYRTAMGRVALPSEDEAALTSHHDVSAQDVMGVFRERVMVVDTDADLGKQLSDSIAAEYKTIRTRNETLSRERSERVLNTLLETLQTKVDAELYHKIGGFAAYQQDFAAVCRDYFQTPGKGVKAKAVLDEFVIKFSTVAKGIMLVDKHLTAAQKQAEEKKLREEVQRLQMEELKRVKAETERLLSDQTRRQEAYEASMKAKFDAEQREHAAQVRRLVSQLSLEQDRLKREGAEDDVDEFAEMLGRLRTRSSLPTGRRLYFM